MPILTAQLGELLPICALNGATLRSDRLRKASVAAFGAEHPVLEERCLLIDGVAMLVRDDLNRSGMVRRGAAMVARAFFDRWIEAVSRIEHRGEAVLFAVAEQTENVWWCASGLADQLPKFLANRPPLRRLFVVNIAEIMLNIRARAEQAGFDLSGGSFFQPPDDKLYLEWMREFSERRAAVQAQFDPLHMKPPRHPSAQQRRVIEGMTCRIH
jgi:hypothetical protein